MGFIKQLKETAVSVLPIAIIAAIAGLGLNVFSTDGVSFVEFIFSVILVVLGLTIFLLGPFIPFLSRQLIKALLHDSSKPVASLSHKVRKME